MKVNNERVSKAMEILFEETAAEHIVDTYEGSDFVEFICTAGGDVMKYRVYNNGKIYER